jgi:hypothetical protein
MADNSEEKAVQDKVDAVIDVLGKGHVVPREVDRIDDAVQRARRDAGVGRAIR